MKGGDEERRKEGEMDTIDDAIIRMRADGRTDSLARRSLLKRQNDGRPRRRKSRYLQLGLKCGESSSFLCSLVILK